MFRDFYTPRTTDCGSVLGGHNILDKEHSAGTLQQHSYSTLVDPSSGSHMQLEAIVTVKSPAEAGAAACMACKGSVSQLQVPEIASEQLSPEQSDMQLEASKVRLFRLASPVPACWLLLLLSSASNRSQQHTVNLAWRTS